MIDKMDEPNQVPPGFGNKGLIFVVDDDKEMQNLLADFLRGEGYEVECFSSADAILSALHLSARGSAAAGTTLRKGAEAFTARPEIDLVITDLKMPGLSGLDFIKLFKPAFPDTPVILATAFGSIESAIEAMRAGAFDYVTKPLKLSELSANVARAMDVRRLQRDNANLRRLLRGQYVFEDIVGKSKPMIEIFDIVKRVAQSNANVLVTGESGTGKEMVARAIHKLSPRAAGPFIAINCSAIPATLLESELFGHAKGSFTGAIRARKGLFVEAKGGTVFLDEIGDMDISMQAKLLRLLQEKKVKPVGEDLPVEIDVRIVCATHRDLKAMAKQGVFREDLFYRISVIPIKLPPLRERREDIPILADYFLKKHAAKNHSAVRAFTPAAMSRLVAARWEGNVRELENVIERAVVLCPGTTIDCTDLPADGFDNSDADQFFERYGKELITLKDLESKYIDFVLEKVGGKKEKAAKILGINRRTLYRREQEENLT